MRLQKLFQNAFKRQYTVNIETQEYNRTKVLLSQ